MEGNIAHCDCGCGLYETDDEKVFYCQECGSYYDLVKRIRKTTEPK